MPAVHIYCSCTVAEGNGRLTMQVIPLFDGFHCQAPCFGAAPMSRESVPILHARDTIPLLLWALRQPLLGSITGTEFLKLASPRLQPNYHISGCLQRSAIAKFTNMRTAGFRQSRDLVRRSKVSSNIDCEQTTGVKWDVHFGKLFESNRKKFRFRRVESREIGSHPGRNMFRAFCRRVMLELKLSVPPRSFSLHSRALQLLAISLLVCYSLIVLHYQHLELEYFWICVCQWFLGNV